MKSDKIPSPDQDTPGNIMVTLLSSQTLLSLGFLRLGLIGLTLINTIIPLLTAVFISRPDRDTTGWYVVPDLITPVMAPLLVTLLLLDIIMNKVHGVDAIGENKRYHQTIVRIDLWVIGLTLLFWIPWFRSIL